MAAAERVLPSSRGKAGTRGSSRVQITSLSAGSRARVMPFATILASHRIGAPRLQRRFRSFGEIRRQIDILRQVGHAAGMDHADDDALGRAEKSVTGRLRRG